jgi:M6 family metalloprotease-like protein
MTKEVKSVRRHGRRLRNRLWFVCFVILFLSACGGVEVKGPEESSILGPQSKLAKGEQRVLMVAVKFPDEEPSIPLERTRQRVVTELNQYVRAQSFDLAWMKADFRGWVKLPSPISEYRISPYNFKVDRTRIRKLVEDTMTALEKEVDFSQYQQILIIPGAHTTPGKGYGMICYCANPGMLTGVKGNLGYATLKSKGGKEFRKGVFVGTENASLGMWAHDFFHTLGGLHEKIRLVPCLYDFERQSDTSQLPSLEHHGIYMGPWDIMSEHFVKRDGPPPGISSFTKIRLGWISPEEALFIRPGETSYAALSPLSQKGNLQVVKIPLKGGRYYLVENRQPIGFDRILPDSGLIILKVDPSAPEGYGTVRVIDADKNSPHFSHATFRLDRSNRNIFVDKGANVAIIPLWPEGENQGVLITTLEKSSDALKAALMIQKLMDRDPRTRRGEGNRLIEESLACFKRYDFRGCYEMVQKGLKD